MMENSNNVVDCDSTHLSSNDEILDPEWSFNIMEHIHKIQLVVDPIPALNTDIPDIKNKSDIIENGCNNIELDYTKENCQDQDIQNQSAMGLNLDISKKCDNIFQGDLENCRNLIKLGQDYSRKEDVNISHSAFETSFDSGVRSPDMFSDDEYVEKVPEPYYWNSFDDYEVYEKRKIKKIEENMQGILPPPSVTNLRMTVTEMLNRYYSSELCTIPEKNVNNTNIEVSTPTKRVSFVQIPQHLQEDGNLASASCISSNIDERSQSKRKSTSDTGTDKSIVMKMCTEKEVKETSWPDILKCKYHDVYYNVTKYSEKLEWLALRYGARFVGAETETSVSVHSGGMQSPSSASKRKALRLKMSQAKSPGSRLSHLARRRNAFCSAANFNEKSQVSSKMVLIDKKKLLNCHQKSPHMKRTPDKHTPLRKTPGKKTPLKTPKTKSGGSSRKKAMRRLLLDAENMTRSQPTRDAKRALFMSPENKNAAPVMSTSSVPLQSNKFRRALFGSPKSGDSTSLDGKQSDHFLKRKRDLLEADPNCSRSKIAKSLSFGGDSIEHSSLSTLNRRASEIYPSRSASESLNETHKKKLLWAVSEALRIHGWRMSTPGFREKASSLARLTRRLLALPPHAAKLAAPKTSTSDTMLKLARQYAYAIIQGRTVDECYQDEQIKLNNASNTKLRGYISVSDYQKMIAKQESTSTVTSQIINNNSIPKQEQPKSSSKKVLHDKSLNIPDVSGNSVGSADKRTNYCRSNQMLSCEEAARMRARRQISFDNVDFPKR